MFDKQCFEKSKNVVVVRFSNVTVDFTKLWPRQLRGWSGIWEL